MSTTVATNHEITPGINDKTKTWHVLIHYSRLTSSQGPYSLSGRKSYRKISWSLEAARLNIKIIIMSVKFQSDWKSINPNIVTSELYEILQ